jgi:hypothetical protein
MWICGHSQHKQLAHTQAGCCDRHNSDEFGYGGKEILYNAAVMWIYMAIHNTNNSPIQAGCFDRHDMSDE